MSLIIKIHINSHPVMNDESTTDRDMIYINNNNINNNNIYNNSADYNDNININYNNYNDNNFIINEDILNNEIIYDNNSSSKKVCINRLFSIILIIIN